MATIGDVARAAGVSRSTVSYALSGKRPISGETRRRIDAAIDRLGFTVNAGARALATAQTKVIGVLLQFHDDEFPPAMLQYLLGISQAAGELGYDILMVTDRDGGRAVDRITASGMVDGVILLDVVHDDPRLEPLRAARQPGALIGLPRDTVGLDVFDLDFGEAARMIVDHLHGLGHRELALICPPRQVFERGGAYAWRFRDAALERAARYRINLHPFYGEATQPGIGRSVRAALESSPTPTGVIVHNDATVAVLPLILQELGRRVPEDLSVVSLFPREFGRSFSLPYTAVETSPDALGRLAIQHLVSRILADGPRPNVVQFVEPELTLRGSTA